MAEEGLRVMAEELRDLLDRTRSEMQGELTAADYARLGALWVRITEAALKCDRHRAQEAERKARLARERQGKAGGGLHADQVDQIEAQLSLL